MDRLASEFHCMITRYSLIQVTLDVMAVVMPFVVRSLAEPASIAWIRLIQSDFQNCGEFDLQTVWNFAKISVPVMPAAR